MEPNELIGYLKNYIEYHLKQNGMLGEFNVIIEVQKSRYSELSFNIYFPPVPDVFFRTALIMCADGLVLPINPKKVGENWLFGVNFSVTERFFDEPESPEDVRRSQVESDFITRERD